MLRRSGWRECEWPGRYSRLRAVAQPIGQQPRQFCSSTRPTTQSETCAGKLSSGWVLYWHSVAERLHIDRTQRQHCAIRNSPGDFHSREVRHRRLYVAPFELAIHDLENVLTLRILADSLSRNGKSILVTGLNHPYAHVGVRQ